MPGTKNMLWPQPLEDPLFLAFQASFGDSDLPKSDNKFYPKNIMTKKLAQTKKNSQN